LYDKRVSTSPTLINGELDGGGRTDGEEIYVDGTNPLDRSDDRRRSDDGLAGGEIDVDISTSLSSLGDGDTDGHAHGYDDRNDALTVDFFDLHGRDLENFPDSIGNPSQAFKLLIVNADLSTGGRLSVNQTYLPTDCTTWLPVTEYDDTPLQDLTVYSLDGSNGTTRLSHLSISFNRLSILLGGVHNTETRCVRDNEAGSEEEWRNGALTIQAVAVNDLGEDNFSTDLICLMVTLKVVRYLSFSGRRSSFGTGMRGLVTGRTIGIAR